MATTSNLDLPLISAQLAQKEVIHNEGLAALDAALTESLSVAVADGANAVTAAQARGNARLVLTAGTATGAFDVTLPAVKRELTITNSTAFDATVKCTGARQAVIEAGASAKVYCDGADVWAVAGGSGGSGATVFTGLVDAPSSYTGQAAKMVAVNAAETGVVFVDAPTTVGINVKTGDYTLVAADAGKLVVIDNASAVTVTVPPTTFPVGTRILLAQYGAGSVTVAAGSGVTVNAPETLMLRGQYAQASLVQLALNVWVLDPYAAADVAAAPYDMGCSVIGKPDAAEVVMRFVAVRAFTLPSALAGSKGGADTAATAQTDFDVRKNGASIGTVRFAASGAIASFIAASGTSFAAGDVLSVVAPASQDATLSDISITFAGTRG